MRDFKIVFRNRLTYPCWPGSAVQNKAAPASVFGEGGYRYNGIPDTIMFI